MPGSLQAGSGGSDFGWVISMRPHVATDNYARVREAHVRLIASVLHITPDCEMGPTAVLYTSLGSSG